MRTVNLNEISNSSNKRRIAKQHIATSGTEQTEQLILFLENISMFVNGIYSQIEATMRLHEIFTLPSSKYKVGTLE